MERQPLPKTVRFEVFKRDKFTCQYCGRSAPEIILEVDHIIPVSKGGDNNIMNLVTSCRDCNRGKGKRTLSDDSAVKIQKQQLDDMQDQVEQFEMMCEWRNSLSDLLDAKAEYIDTLFCEGTTYSLNDLGKKKVKLLIKQFGFEEVCDSCEISILKYFNNTKESAENAFHKIGGICFNRQKAREADA